MATTKKATTKKAIYTTGMVLGVLSIPCGLIIAISGWILGIIGIVINNKNKEKYNTKVGLILSIVGLVLSILNSVLGVVLATLG